MEGLFWKDVEGLVNDYNKESKKSKWIQASKDQNGCRDTTRNTEVVMLPIEYEVFF